MNFSNLSSTFLNATATDSEPPEWNLAAGWELALGLSIFIANTSMFVVLLTEKGPRSFFTIYLMLLFACNTVFSLIYYSTEIIHQVTHQWLLGTSLCTFRLYNDYVVATAQVHSHLVITINRIWASAFPVSYRNYHTVKVTFWICLGMLLYVNLIQVPALLVDALYYRLDEAVNGCHLNYGAQNTWMVAVQFIAFDIPVAFVCGAYPFLWYLNRKRTRRVGSKMSLSLAVTGPKTMKQNHRTKNDDPGSISVTEKNHLADKRKKPSTRPFRILTMLTTSICVCWTPDLMYYTVASFTEVPFDMAFTVIDNLYNVQALLDPLLFAISSDSVRQMVARLWRKVVRR